MSFFDIQEKESQVVKILFGGLDRKGKVILKFMSKMEELSGMLNEDAYCYPTRTVKEPSAVIEYDFEGPIDHELVLDVASIGGVALNQNWVKIILPDKRTFHLRLNWEN